MRRTTRVIRSNSSGETEDVAGTSRMRIIAGAANDLPPTGVAVGATWTLAGGLVVVGRLGAAALDGPGTPCPGVALAVAPLLPVVVMLAALALLSCPFRSVY